MTENLEAIQTKSGGTVFIPKQEKIVVSESGVIKPAVTDTRPFMHLKFPDNHIKPDGRSFVDDNPVCIDVTIRATDDPNSPIITQFTGEFFCILRNRGGLDIWGTFIKVTEGKGMIHLKKSDFPPQTTVVYMDENDYPHVQFVEDFTTYVV